MRPNEEVKDKMNRLTEQIKQLKSDLKRWRTAKEDLLKMFE